MHVRMSVCGYVKPTICSRKVLCGSCMIGTRKIQDVDLQTPRVLLDFSLLCVF